MHQWDWFPLSLSKSYSLLETKGSLVHQPFKFVSLKVINFHGRISLGNYSLWEEAFFPLWFWSHRLNLIWFLSSFSQPIYYSLVSLIFLIKKLLLNCDYLFLSKDYLFTLIKMSKYFILFYYYHICLPQLIWNNSVRRKHAPDRRGIVCTQARLDWVVVWPVSTPLLRIFGPSTAGGSPAQPDSTKKGPPQPFIYMSTF